MKQLQAMFWKEWHEVRIFLLIGLGIFVGLPAAGGLEAYYQAPAHGFPFYASGWVMALGGVLAVFVAVGATCRDFRGHLEDFWRSRPVGVVTWLVVKYLVGLLVVLISILVPLLLEYSLDVPNEEAAEALLAIPFTAITIYSLGFLAGALIRRAAHAAMLGLAALLLVYFLPMVLPPLEWMSLQAIMDHAFWGRSQWLWSYNWRPEVLHFAGGMLAVGAAALALALISVRRNWHVDSGRKMMYGSVSAAFLILFASGAYQLGTNLPVLQQVDLPAGDQARSIVVDQDIGYASIYHWFYKPQMTQADYFSQWSTRLFRITPNGIELQDSARTGLPQSDIEGTFRARSRASGVTYELTEPDDTQERTYYRIEIRNAGLAHVVPLRLPIDFDRNDTSYWNFTIYRWKDRLYVIGRQLITLDVSQPLAPRILSSVPFSFPDQRYHHFHGEDKSLLSLPNIPDLPAPQRLEATLKSIMLDYKLDDDMLCNADADSLFAYRLTNLTDAAATFDKIGQYDATMLQKIFGHFAYQNIKMQNELCYVTQAGGLFNPIIYVFDLAGPHPLRLIAHFAAPNGYEVCPLPDGRALVGGDKLWLVGPPPRRGE